MKALAAAWPRCPGKAAYYTHELAEKNRHIRAAREGFKLYTYRCPTCRLWHLTKQPQEIQCHAQR